MKKSKNEIMNLIFSAFLVTAFMVCSGFFLGMINDSFSQDAVKRTLFVSLIFALFGGLLFYATRVGDGKQVFRFSAATLVIMVLPALYVVLASVVSGMPLHEQIASRSELSCIAAAVFGYGLPYTFLSGYELDCGGKKNPSSAENEKAEESEAVEETLTAGTIESEAEETLTEKSEESEAEEALTEDAGE